MDSSWATQRMFGSKLYTFLITWCRWTHQLYLPFIVSPTDMLWHFDKFVNPAYISDILQVAPNQFFWLLSPIVQLVLFCSLNSLILLAYWLIPITGHFLVTCLYRAKLPTKTASFSLLAKICYSPNQVIS